MIMTGTPVRIPLGGGGTDLASYYSKYGGSLVAAAINKYIFVTVSKQFEDSIRIKYSRTEIVGKVEEIQHPIVREGLKLLGCGRALEITTIADVPARTGLGTSGSFTVGLLHALHSYKRESITRKALAEEACKIEIDILGEPIGKQDQYMAAFGGITCLTFDKDGEVTVTPLNISPGTIKKLERHIVLFYTGIRRQAADILSEQNEASEKDDKKVIESLHRIKKIGEEVKVVLECGNVHRFGELLDLHWQTKKNLSNKVSRPEIDRWYALARKNGALGGKIMGAGAGGFFMFYVEDDRNRLSRAMKGESLTEMRFKFDLEGSKVVINS